MQEEIKTNCMPVISDIMSPLVELKTGALSGFASGLGCTILCYYNRMVRGNGESLASSSVRTTLYNTDLRDNQSLRVYLSSTHPIEISDIISRAV